VRDDLRRLDGANETISADGNADGTLEGTADGIKDGTDEGISGRKNIFSLNKLLLITTF
jgi:hypothetical protein